MQKYKKICLPLHFDITTLRIILLSNKIRKMKKGIIVILALVVLAIAWGISIYNGLVTKQEGVEKAIGNVQTAYQKRADLIPNLVATVKNYAEYEQGTLTAVVEARAKATSVTLDPTNLSEETLKAYMDAQNELSGALSRLLVTVEQYPDLKANENYLNLQSQLEGCENSIANARREWQEAVRVYNTAVRRFPANVIASMFGFEKSPYFEASEGAQTAPDVKELFE